MTKKPERYWALDTETRNRAGAGEAILVQKMTPEGVKLLEFPKVFNDIFDFLAPDKGVTKYVAWNMDFDSRALVHDFFLPFEVPESLGLYGRAAHKGYSFRYVPSKFIEIRKRGRGIAIYDLAQFYGSSLAKATEKYLPSDYRKRKLPRSWYPRMDVRLRDRKTRGRLIDYAVRDVESTQKLGDNLVNQIVKLGIKVRRLSSCASLARIKFGSRLVSNRPPDWQNRLYERSFYGGRIETRTLGTVNGLRLYDLGSAYPSVFSHLPSIEKADTLSTRGMDKWTFRDADFGSYVVRVEVPLHWNWGPLSYRTAEGRIIYPVGRFTTSCGAEAIRVLRKHRIDFDVIDAHEIFVKDHASIFPEVPELYAIRKASDMGLAIKTTLNAAYGICAESTNHYSEDNVNGRLVAGRRLRSYSRYGRLTNFVYAGQITEVVRMRVWEVLHRFQSHALFAATDGVLLTSACQMDAPGGLGEWELKGDYTHGTILGCGRYILNGNGFRDFHLRGFPHSIKTFDRLARCRRSYAMLPALDTKTLKVWALSMGDDLNVLTEVRRRLSLMDDKRIWPKRFRQMRDAFVARIDSQAPVIWEDWTKDPLQNYRRRVSI